MWWELGIARVYRVATSRLDAVPKDRKWFPLVKSASKGKWLGLHHEVLNYSSRGSELLASREDGTNPGHRHDNPDTFFRPGVAFPLLSSKGLSARMVHGGFIYDVSSPFVLTEQPEFACAFLNSSLAAYLLSMLNPTLNFPPGDVGRLPVKSQTMWDSKSHVQEAAYLTAESINEDETTYSFVSPPSWSGGGETVTARHEQLAHIEQQIDKEIFRLYEISDVDRETIEEDLTEVEAVTEGDDNDTDGNAESGEEYDEHVSLTPEDLAKRWFSYGVGVALCRFQPGVEGALGSGTFIPETAAKFKQFKGGIGLMGLMEGHPEDLATRVVEILRIIHGDTHAEQIVHTATGTEGPIRQSAEEYLLGSFFKEHVKLYRKRPVYWLLQSPARKYSVYLFHERATDQTLAILQSKRYLGGRVHILENHLQEAKSKESATSGREKAVWVKKVRELAEELEDLKAFDRHISAANNVPIQDAHGKPATAHWSPEFDDGVLLNVAPLHELAPSWKRADAKLDLKKAWKDLEKGEFDWAKTAMRYWPQRVLKACQKNKSFGIAQGLA